VRGLAHDGARLYVADEAGNAVKGYNAASGELEWRFHTPAPVHLLLDGSDLLVGSGDEVIRVEIGNGKPKMTTPVKSVSGIALGSDGMLYAAQRTKNRVVAGAEGGNLERFGPKLKDEPEFILLAS
jgi:outer membrane protein assembly factor BamB